MRFYVSNEKARAAVAMMADGLPDHEIAKALGLTGPTVYRLRKNVLDWFDHQDRVYKTQLTRAESKVRRLQKRVAFRDGEISKLKARNRELRAEIRDLKQRRERRAIKPAFVSRPTTDHHPRYRFPQVRGECLDGHNAERPCPWVRCRYHLAIVSTTRKVVNQVDDPESMDQTCALDLADEGPQTLEYIGGILGLTRERVRQIQEMAFGKLRERFPELLRGMRWDV